MKTCYTILQSLALLLLASACNEELKPKPYTYTQVFTGESSRSWKLTRLTIKEDGKGDVNFNEADLRQALGACAADDLYTFHADPQKTFEVLEGATTCKPGDPQVYLTDTWSFSNANATLSFVFPVLADVRLPYFVRNVDDSQMEIEIFLDENNTSSYRMVFKATNSN
ncbi:hypothetical protein [Chryseolinea lacunae]|uniref:DUF5004 domain-containing protein n=1 Tax=Chryseolinea lacunae TaxID=2801331 RepID=A0ABS1L0T9_9BACT|nr:hypothetical protein [Chryseolinea lacunae]MBL0745264.1 hypothetical protein [Chryseolinea lacunae]